MHKDRTLITDSFREDEITLFLVYMQKSDSMLIAKYVGDVLSFAKHRPHIQPICGEDFHTYTLLGKQRPTSRGETSWPHACVDPKEVSVFALLHYIRHILKTITAHIVSPFSAIWMSWGCMHSDSMSIPQEVAVAGLSSLESLSLTISGAFCRLISAQVQYRRSQDKIRLIIWSWSLWHHRR